MQVGDSLLDRLVGQLDTLIAFLALSREDVFAMLSENRLAWFADTEDALPAAYFTYQKQINHSAFLLGYSYFETFLADLLKSILRSRPTMLPNESKIEYREILNCSDMAALLERILDREVHGFFYKSMSDVVAILRSKYSLTVHAKEEYEIVRASLLRNCIMHNSSRVCGRLAKHCSLVEGQPLELTTSDIHSFGMTLRTLVSRLCSEAESKHGVSLFGL